MLSVKCCFYMVIEFLKTQCQHAVSCTVLRIQAKLQPELFSCLLEATLLEQERSTLIMGRNHAIFRYFRISSYIPP